MAEASPTLTLSVDAGQSADLQESAELTRRLRQFMLDSNVDKVDFVRTGEAPAGSKGDIVSLTSLAVTIAPVALTTLAGILQSWLTRHDRASVTVESGGEKVTITGSLSREQQQTLNAFLDRHKTSPA
jgi:hypothetical protein